MHTTSSQEAVCRAERAHARGRGRVQRCRVPHDFGRAEAAAADRTVRRQVKLCSSRRRGALHTHTHANIRTATQTIRFSVLAFWDEYTMARAGSMPFHRYCSGLLGSTLAIQ